MCDEDDEPVFHIVYASVKIGKRLNGSSYYYPNVSDYQ